MLCMVCGIDSKEIFFRKKMNIKVAFCRNHIKMEA